MALFSRRNKRGDSAPMPAGSTGTDAESEAVPDALAPESADPSSEAVAAEASVESVPQVSISVSTFGQPDTARPIGVRRPTATAPAPTETVPGMPDNVVLQAALAALPEQPQNTDIMNVMRQALQGQLYMRAQGDAQALLAEGKGLNLAITTYQDKRFLLVFSGGGPMRVSTAAEGSEAVSAIGQLAHNVFRTAVDSGYDGVYLDHANPGARLILPIALIRKALEEGVPPFELKSLLVAERGDATPLQAAEVLTRTRVWVAGGTDPSGRVGLAEARGADGVRRLEIYSHPLEVIAMGRGDRPLPLTPEQLGKTLASEPGPTGVVLDAAGPWIELDRDALAPVIALGA